MCLEQTVVFMLQTINTPVWQGERDAGLASLEFLNHFFNRPCLNSELLFTSDN